tara:strand:- start:310 stop:933 length:624 start_codon:yes stop_codon:yes gene_type:complete
MKKNEGRFITIEGGEGTGKTTLVNNLKTFIESKGIKCFVTREPGGTKIAENLRSVLVNNDFDLDQEIDILSFARSEHVSKSIRKKLGKGIWVISDRFFDSTMAYQGFMHPERFKEIQQYCHLASGKYIPDLTIWLDLDSNTGLERVKEKNNFEKRGLEFHEKIRENFKKVSDVYPQRVIKLDINKRNEKEVFDLASYLLRGEFSELE